VYTQRDFFNAVLPQDGLPLIAWKVPGSPGGFSHKLFDNIDELCEFTSRIDFRRANYYFGISTFKERFVIISNQKRVRVKQNTLQTRCIILDIDMKDGHYASIDDAVDEVNACAQALKMPTPIIVYTGGGLHVYWPMAAGIDSKAWVNVTKKFRKKAQVLYPALFADPTRVSDEAGVLRIPDSFNLKYDEKPVVEIIQWVDGALEVDAEGVHKQPELKPSKRVSLELEQQTTAVPLKKIVKNCDWVKDYILHKADASEPEWYAMLGLAPYITHDAKDGRTLNGADIAQFLSQGHDGYDPEATAIKFTQAKEGQTGPTTCERFESICPERCAACPFRNAVKTPLHAAVLARPATEEETVTATHTDRRGDTVTEQVTIPLYPHPYFRGEEGGVFVRAKRQQDDGTFSEVIEPIYDYDIYPVRRLRGENVNFESMWVQVWFPQDGLIEFPLPSELLAEPKKLASYLAARGVIPPFGGFPRVAQYMINFIRHLQTVGAAQVEFTRFGWRDAMSGNPKFVVGNGCIDKEGNLKSGSFAHFLNDASKSVTTAGNLEEWKQGFAVYETIPNSDAFIMASMMGFAAPLMALTPYKGVLYNMVGSSAAGKSTALQVMTSVWGQPTETHIKVSGGRGRDTEIAMYNLIGYLNAIPVAMDELTNMEPESLSDFALSFTSGRGKMRADRDGHNKLNETEWETIVVGTSNTSMYEKLASHRHGYSAEAMRIFELKVPPSDPAYKQHVETHIKKLQRNYGHAGRVYMEYLIKNLSTVQGIVDKTIERITREGHLRNDERFWGVMFACVLVGGTIAKKLGLHNYDVGALIQRYTSTAPDVREAIRASLTDPVSLLSEFFNQRIDSMVRINSDGRPYLGLDGRGLQNLRSILIRMELAADTTPALAYISVPALRDYCNQRKIDFAWLSKELRDLGVFTKNAVQMRIAAGTGLPSTSIKCFIVDMTHPRLTDVSQGIMEDTQIADEISE